MDSEYMREYRRTRPTQRKAQASAATARLRALNRLADLHYDKFVEFYNEEREKLDLPPLRGT